MKNNLTVRGFVEGAKLGRGFIFLSGWVSTLEKTELKGELILRVEGGSEVVVTERFYRADLERVGIAAGRGGFAVSVKTDAVYEFPPQVFARQPGTDEALISGPGTRFDNFAPLGAFDSAGPEGIKGWLYHPGEDDPDAHVLVGGAIRLPIVRSFARHDLPYDFGTAQKFGFVLDPVEIEQLIAQTQPSTAADHIDLVLMAEAGSIASTRLAVRHTSQATADVTDDAAADRRQATPAASNLTICIERVMRGHGRIMLRGWIARSDHSAAKLPLRLSLDHGLDHGVEIIVPELDDRPDLAGRGIAGGAAGFVALFDWPDQRPLPSALRVTSNDRSEISAVGVPAELVSDQTTLHQITLRGHVIRGCYFDLAAPLDEVELVFDGTHLSTVPLEPLADNMRLWSFEGQVATGFEFRVRDACNLIRAANPHHTFAPGQSTRVGIRVNGSVVAEAEIELLQPTIGRLETVENDRVSGWIASGNKDSSIVEYDVFINGVRYLTARADAIRSDLVAKEISINGGGFRFEPVNPEFGSKQIELKVAAAFGKDFLDGVDGRLELASFAQPGLSRLYSVIAATPPRDVSIIVPIYNAADDLQLCLSSVIAHTAGQACLILIDDCSPDPRIGEILQAYRGHDNIVILSNDSNQGFTKTVNRGIAAAGSDDVVLLNSDTIVSAGWLQGLRLAAYSGPRVATATAVSNNAGVFSVPEINADNALPNGWQVDDIARLVRQCSLTTYPRVPTGNGFCMFVRRDCIEAIGPLDEVGFPVGYGEENDFCMRAAHAGYEHVCDDRTYVYHKRSASFGSRKSAHLANGRDLLHQRYPEYSKLIGIFEHGSQMLAMRWRVRRALLASAQQHSRPRPRVCYVISTVTGGTPQTNRDLMAALSDRYEPWLLRCDSKRIEVSRFGHDGDEPIETVDLRDRIVPTSHRSSEYDEEALKILIRYGFELVHIRHLGWHSANLSEICRLAGIPVILSFHDFYTVCPTTKLLDDTQTYCAGACTESGGDCRAELWEASLLPPLKHRFVHRWRQIFAKSFEACDAFVTTSSGAAAVLTANYPEQLNRDFHIIPHGRSFADIGQRAAPIDPERPLKVLVPGNISSAKGADIIRGIAELDEGQRVEFHILGDAGRLQPGPGVIVHGLYRREQFGSLVDEIKPNVGAVLSIWPETYCHTLTEMWSSGLPVIGIDIGAVGERIAQHGGGWLLPLNVSAAAVLQALWAIRAEPAQAATKVDEVLRWQAGTGRIQTTHYMGLKYDRLYRQASRARRSFASLSPEALVQAVVIASDPGNPLLTRLVHRGAESRLVPWHWPDDWRALQPADVTVDALIVAAHDLTPQDGAGVVALADRLQARLFTVVASDRMGSTAFYSPDGTNDSSDLTLFAASEAVLTDTPDIPGWIHAAARSVVQIDERAPTAWL